MSDRSEDERTDASLPTSAKGFAMINTDYTFFSDDQIRNSKPETILNRMLSTKSYISTTSSIAAISQQAQEDTEQRGFKQIGSGQCGTVYALIGTTEVLKVPNPGKMDGLWNDAQMHKQVEEAFGRTSLELRQHINIPRFGQWVLPADTTFWNRYRKYFPQSFQPTHGIVSNRIFALPFPVRAAIFDSFAARGIQKSRDSHLAKPENKDCLVRLYLGRRFKEVTRSTIALRNFPLHANDMEHLGLDTSMYAKTIANALAIIHWEAKVDANDVEFVLGSAPKLRTPASAAEMKNSSPDDPKFLRQTLNFNYRSVGIWLLDFNNCKGFPENDAGLKQLVDGFYWNDPYYPRPVNMTAEDRKLWETFKQAYLEASSKLIKSNGPRLFIEAVEIEGKKRSQSAAGSLFG